MFPSHGALRVPTPLNGLMRDAILSESITNHDSNNFVSIAKTSMLTPAAFVTHWNHSGGWSAFRVIAVLSIFTHLISIGQKTPPRQDNGKIRSADSHAFQ
jgi:hypothetical protein